VENAPPKDYPLADHDAHARSVAPDAYWQQVRRTVKGEPVDEGQIALIIDAITAGLALRPDDVVLDLACGNGALSLYLFDKCAGLVGVDLSAYLIEVAQKSFARPPRYVFVLDDIAAYVSQGGDGPAFTKALIYGAFQYISRGDALLVLKGLREKFPQVARVFIGNIPDKQRVGRFYRDRNPADAELNDHEARLGIWYLRDELEQMAQAAGWRSSFSHMPDAFYAAGYRFDVTLDRVGS